MSEINILLIEDDDVQIDTFEDSVQSYNKKRSDIKIVYEVARNFEEGEMALRSPLYDAALIDLKLTGADSLEGRELIERINQKLRIPVIVYSGSIAQIEDIKENILLRKRVRGDTLVVQILDEVVEIYQTGITGLLRQDGLVDNILTEIFWKHLSDSLFDLRSDSPVMTERILTRYIASHLQEFLEMNDAGEYENLHPAEFYIFPPIKTDLNTGNIIKDSADEAHYLLLTPACDIQLRTKKDGKFRNADNGLLIKLINWNAIENFSSLTKNSSSDKKGRLADFVSNKKERYHFLPPYRTLMGYFADFQQQKSISVTDLEKHDQFVRVATVSQFFLKDIIARFSQYYSRQGQPDLMKDLVMRVLLGQNDVMVKK